MPEVISLLINRVEFFQELNQNVLLTMIGIFKCLQGAVDNIIECSWVSIERVVSSGKSGMWTVYRVLYCQFSLSFLPLVSSAILEPYIC